MESFKVGDRVIIVGPRYSCLEDKRGTVIKNDYGSVFTTVELDDNEGVKIAYTENLDYDQITIRTDGHKTVTAHYGGSCKAKAQCSPDDEFNIMTGIEIALNRLKEQIGAEASERFALDKLEQSTDKPETSNEPDDEPGTGELQGTAQDRAIYAGGVTITHFNLTINKGDTK